MYNPKHIFCLTLEDIKKEFVDPETQHSVWYQRNPTPLAVTFYGQDLWSRMSQEADLTLRSRARATCTQLLSTQTDHGGDNSREKSEPRKRVSGAPRMETTGERTADLPHLRGQRSERRIAATAGADVTRGRAPWPGSGDRERGHRESCLVLGEERNGLIGFLYNSIRLNSTQESQ